MTRQPFRGPSLEHVVVALVLLLGCCATVVCGFDAMAKASLLEAQFLQHQDSRTALR